MKELIREFVSVYLNESDGSKRYWGIGGAGMIFICAEDKTVFLQRRGMHVSGGAGQWAFPGGGIHADEEYEEYWFTPIPAEYVLDNFSERFYNTAVTEVEEECGSVPQHAVVDSYLYEDAGFKYRTFIATVALKDKKAWEINPEAEFAEESMGEKWFTKEQFDKANLFFGFTPELKSKVRKRL